MNISESTKAMIIKKAKELSEKYDLVTPVELEEELIEIVNEWAASKGSYEERHPTEYPQQASSIDYE